VFSRSHELYMWALKHQKCHPVNSRPRKILRIFAVILAERNEFTHELDPKLQPVRT
jgi:hypothetical protein